jgi:hypothetical protein
MSNEFYSNDSGMIVNSSSVSDGNGTIYQLRNINSVKTVEHQVPWIKSILFKLIWMGPAFVILPMLAGLINQVLIPIIALLVVAGVGYSIFKTIKQPKVIFSLILSTSSGEVDSFSSLDRDEVNKMANAVSEALASMSNVA